MGNASRGNLKQNKRTGVNSTLKKYSLLKRKHRLIQYKDNRTNPKGLSKYFELYLKCFQMKCKPIKTEESERSCGSKG